MRCFQDSPSLSRLDRAPFKFGHTLLGHPALGLDNLARVLPALPKARVHYSKGFLKNGDDFESALCKGEPRAMSIEETIEQIRVSDSYIMVDGPQEHASFAPLYRELIGDVETIMRRCGVGERVTDPRLFLFIASPNSVTPFHIDRYSNFLMQFRGSKEVSVFPQWDERLVSSENKEAYVALANTKLPWKPEFDALGTKFDFRPGDAVHIPFTAGHHVRNGADDISISLSIFFSTRESLAWQNALRFNHASRGMLQRVGMTPAPVGHQPWRDVGKSYMWRAMRGVRQTLR
jgi:hypothetical protein